MSSKQTKQAGAGDEAEAIQAMLEQMSGGNPEALKSMLAGSKNAKGSTKKNKALPNERLPLGDNGAFSDVVLDEKGFIGDYGQDIKQSSAALDRTITKLHRDRDPRLFVAEGQERISAAMRNFLRLGDYPKLGGITAATPAHEQLLTMLYYAPEREPESLSYLHAALTNPKWTAKERRHIVRSLLEYQVNPNREWASEFVAERAVRLGDPQIVIALLQAGADPHVRDKDGFNLLTQAIATGNGKLVPILARFNVRPEHTAKGDSPLMVAIYRFEQKVESSPESAYKEFFDAVALMYQYGKLPAKKHPNDPLIPEDTPEFKRLKAIMTPLGPAHQESFQRTINALNQVQRYSDEQLTSMVKTAPVKMAPFTNPGFMQARRRPHWLSLGALNIFRGALDRKESSVGDQVLDALFAAANKAQNNDDFLKLRHGERTAKLFDELVPRRRDIVNLDKPQNTPPGDTLLHRAARIGSPDFIDFCMREGANLHVVNDDGDYPIHVAARQKDPRVLKNMLTKLVGRINPATGERESMYDGQKISDLRMLNGEGKTFLDVIREEHGLAFAKEVADHLGLSKEEMRGLLVEDAPEAPVLDRPVPVLSTDVPGARYMNVRATDELPPSRPASGVDLADEMSEYYRRKEDDIYKMAAMLSDPDITDERREDIVTALKSSLSVTPLSTKIGIMLGAMDKLDENRQGSEKLNALRAAVYKRVGIELASSLKDPNVRKELLDLYERYTPEGKQRADQIFGSISALEGDIEGVTIANNIIKPIDLENSHKHAPDNSNNKNPDDAPQSKP